MTTQMYFQLSSIARAHQTPECLKHSEVSTFCAFWNKNNFNNTLDKYMNYSG